MKATELLKQYAEGKRDFKRENLRGQNFSGEDLSGCDFSECHIQGANFKKAILIGTNFTGATAGLQKRWMIGLLLLALLFIGLSSFFSIFLVYKMLTYLEQN